MIYGGIKRLINWMLVIVLHLYKIKEKDGFLWKISNHQSLYIQIMVLNYLYRFYSYIID